MWNAGLDEAQAGIKIAGRNINNLRYADDSTLMAESEEELKSLLMKVKKESEELAWKSTFRKQRSWCPITSWQIVGENMETVMEYILGLQNHCRWWLQPWNKKTLAPWKKSYKNLDIVLKSRDITLLTKICIVKAMVFPAVVCRCESLTTKAERRKIDAIKLQCWRSLLEYLGLQGDQTSPS